MLSWMQVLVRQVTSTGTAEVSNGGEQTVLMDYATAKLTGEELRRHQQTGEDVAQKVKKIQTG